MKKSHVAPLALLAVVVVVSGAPGPRRAHAEPVAGRPAPAAAPVVTAGQIVAHVVEADLWGLGGAEVNAKVVVTEKGGKQRSLAFDAKSRQHVPPLTKSLITFRAPADVAGMKFLQIQNPEADDERFLYAPEMKRSRRIAASNRNESFMGTDFSYADLDGRDLRQSQSVRKADEPIGKFDCWHVDVTPKNGDSVYGHIEIWVRKDNFVPLKWIMFDKRSVPAKTLVAKELQRIGGRWFITSSRMTDHVSGRTSELLLEKVDRREDIPLDTFSIRTIEKG
jgi:hypothetical protein